MWNPETNLNPQAKLEVHVNSVPRLELNRERDDHADCEIPKCKPDLTSARLRRLLFSVFAMCRLKQRGCYIRLECGLYVCVLRLGAAGVHGLAAGLKLVRNVVVS